MADQKRGWKQFQKMSFDSKHFSKRVKKAETATTRHAHKFIVKRMDNIRNSRRQIIGWLVLVGLMIAAVALQLMWFQRSYQTVAADTGGTYAEAMQGEIDTLNPLYASSSAEVAASKLMFSSLYSYDETGHLQGDLAENISVDETGKIYTVTIRPNAVWHDGVLLSADDVAFTVDLIKNPETRSSLRVNWQDVQVKAINDVTVQFTLPAVYASFPHALTFSVLPKHILESVPAGAMRENVFSRSPVGSGPFSYRLLQTSDTGHQHKVVHMSAFEKYYKGAPKLNRFEVHAYTDSTDIIKALKTGEVSAAAGISAAEAKGLDRVNYKVISRPINNGVYALFNNNNPILKDVNVRKALRLATNTQEIRDSLGSKPPSLDLPFVNGQLSGPNVPKAPLPNATQASQILDKAGWKLVDGIRENKKKQKLAVTITTIKDDQYEKTLDILARQWRSIGVAVNTKIIDTSSPSANFVQNTLQRRDYDVLLYELLIGADPDVYAYWHSSQVGAAGYNFTNYSNKTSDAALASARSRLEPELRNAKYITFARQWLDDAPAIGLYQPVMRYAVNSGANTIADDATLISPTDRYANILYWSVKEKSVYKTP